MSDSDLPDRIQAKLVIDLDFAKADQHLIHPILMDIIGKLSFSSAGDGRPTQSSRFSYKLESNLPSAPVTTDVLLDLIDSNLAPGEQTSREQIAEMLHPDYAEAQQWWEGLNDSQREWLRAKFVGVNSVTVAWEKSKGLEFSERAFLQALSPANLDPHFGKGESL